MKFRSNTRLAVRRVERRKVTSARQTKNTSSGKGRSERYYRIYGRTEKKKGEKKDLDEKEDSG